MQSGCLDSRCSPICSLASCRSYNMSLHFGGTCSKYIKVRNLAFHLLDLHAKHNDNNLTYLHYLMLIYFLLHFNIREHDWKRYNIFIIYNYIWLVCHAKKITCNKNITALLFFTNNIMICEKIILRFIALFIENSKKIVSSLHESFSPNYAEFFSRQDVCSFLPYGLAAFLSSLLICDCLFKV